MNDEDHKIRTVNPNSSTSPRDSSGVMYLRIPWAFASAIIIPLVIGIGMTANTMLVQDQQDAKLIQHDKAIAVNKDDIAEVEKDAAVIASQQRELQRRMSRAEENRPLP